jgi:hypothetical protein
MLRFRIFDLLRSYITNWHRFALASSIAFVAAISAVVLINVDLEGRVEDYLASLLLVCMITFPLSIAAILVHETFRNTQSWKILSHFTILVLAVLGIWLHMDRLLQGRDWAVMTMFGLIVSAHLLVAFVGYIGRSNQLDFWEYNRQLLGNFITGAVYTIILWGGISLAILAIDNLFEVQIKSDYYLTWWALSWILMSTSFFLFHFPKDLVFSADEMQFDGFFLSVTKYLLIPLSLLYFFILYAYGAKILLLWHLPKGWVSSLCIGFSIAGIFTWLLNYLLPQFHSNKLLSTYKKWFWPSSIPIIMLLMVGIGKRLIDYGITEERYIVICTAIWLFINSLYFGFYPKEKQRLWFLPFSLAIVSTLIVLGPMNARNMARWSQSTRLVNALKAKQIFVDGKVISPNNPTFVEESVIDGLQYLGNRDSIGLCKTLGVSLGDTSIFKFGYFSTESLIEYLKLVSSEVNTDTFFSFSNATAQIAYDISGAQMRLPVPYQIETAPSDQSGPLIGYDIKMTNILYYQNGVCTDTISLSPVQAFITQQIAKGTNENQFSSMPIRLKGKKVDLLYMPNSISGTKDSSALGFTLNEIYGEFYLLDRVVVEKNEF